MHHIQVNGVPLCRANSKAYITALEICSCRHDTAEKAVRAAYRLEKALSADAREGEEKQEITVVAGLCDKPMYVCENL